MLHIRPYTDSLKEVIKSFDDHEFFMWINDKLACVDEKSIILELRWWNNN
jgi:hypothetical protein